MPRTGPSEVDLAAPSGRPKPVDLDLAQALSGIRAPRVTDYDRDLIAAALVRYDDQTGDRLGMRDVADCLGIVDRYDRLAGRAAS